MRPHSLLKGLVMANIKKSDFSTSIEQLFSECKDILKVKGNDYTDNKDRLSNFRGFPGLDQKVALAVYMHKHYIAVQNYCLRGKLESEPIRGRICDMINYLLLLNYMVETTNEKEVAKNEADGNKS